MPITTIAAAAAALSSGALSAVDLLEESLQAIERHQSWTNAFIRVDADDARAAARQADRERKAGAARGPLHGIPISLKDLIDVAGQPTTAASRVFRDRVAKEDARLVKRLRAAGVVFIGKTNLHEFALGTTSDESAWGPVRHPLDAARSPGGSSGGSAAAVATGMGLASIGSDTGGSIRIPAAACGVVGLKPSFGEVPIEGLVPLSVSLDHVGPLARTVEDAGFLWAALTERPLEPIATVEPAAISLSLLSDYFSTLGPEVRLAFGEAIGRLRTAGISVTEARIPNTEAIPSTYVNVVLPEAAAWHQRHLSRHAGDYSPGVRTRLESGRSISAVDYLRAREAANGFRQAVDALFDPSTSSGSPRASSRVETASALVLPTLPIVAPLIGAEEIVIDPDRPAPVPVRAAMLKHTQLFNLTGHPAISLPIPTTGLPVGLQLVGRRDRTADLLSVARAIEALLR